MASFTGFAILTLCVSSCLADVNVTEYIYWKKADLQAWHKFFPSRALQEERGTNIAALNAVSSLKANLNSSLSHIVSFQMMEMETAKYLWNGTNAEGCVNGIANFLPQAISDEMSIYTDRTYDASSKLTRMLAALSDRNTSYQATYQRAQSGIDMCAKTYPNKDSYSRLQSCVEAMVRHYHSVANDTMNSVFPSPSMGYFQSAVVGSASKAATATAGKGYEFNTKLVYCSSLSGTTDPDDYAQQLSTWKGYNDTLAEQIVNAQNNNYDQVWTVEKELLDYYQLQKSVLLQFVVEARDFNFYLSKMYSYLSDYYNTVTATSLDNPGDSSCTAAARESLDSVAATGVAQSLTCDVIKVNNTRTLFANVYNDFWALNQEMPFIGNVAVLNCITKGYVFAPHTISDCFNLNYSRFNVDYLDRHVSIEQTVAKLEEYFRMGTDLPCGGTSLQRLLLGGDVALYDLQRCLYSASGTTYSVTTPAPSTTTYTPSTTTVYN